MKDDTLSRRTVVSGAARTFLGLSALSVFSNWVKPLEAAPARFREPGKAKSVIYLFMNGGMSQLDTFDTKPGSDTQGPVESIKTNADGILISQFFPNMAHQMDKVAVINSMYSSQGAHEQGRYFMHTSYEMRGTIRHPDLGAWSAFHLGKINPGLPANVKVGGNSAGLGGGFLESEFAALPIGDPTAGLQHSKLPRRVSESRFANRMQRLEQMNREFADQHDTKLSRAYTQMYDEAVRLMKSEDLQAFDLTQEKPAVRDRYGDNPFGQACLLARRLVQHGVRFIEVDNGGWDTHTDNFDQVETKGAILDQALAALIGDLSENGLLEETLVVLATEFGRTPTIVMDQNNGRNHYPQAFTCLLAGGGIKGGIRHGKTDAKGHEIIEDRVTIPDFNATIAYALGIPLNAETHSPSQRPFKVADTGQPVLELFA